MNKEYISNKQAIILIILFVIGSSLVISSGSSAKQDAWLATLIALILAFPMVIVYARILKLFPGLNLFQILDQLYGKIFGRIISLLFIWYFLHLGSLVVRNFYEFGKMALFMETPEYVFIIFKIILIIWVLKEGIEVLGRWAQFSIYLVTIIFFTVTVLSLPNADIDNLRPLLYEGFRPVLKGSFEVFSFPFVEVVCFLGIFHFSKKNKPTKIFITGLIIGAFFLLFATVRNLLVLGPNLIEILYFPSFSAISLINIADFIQRIEASVAVVLFFGGFVKISVCLLSATKGISYIFNINDYRSIVAPIAFLMIILSLLVFNNTMEMFEWAVNVYPYYAFSFQVIIPLIIWIFAEMKAKEIKKEKTE